MKRLKRLLKSPIKYPLILSLVILAFFVAGGLFLRTLHVPVFMPSGEIADQQRDLIIFTLILAAIVVIPVFVLLVVFAVRYRESNSAADYQPEMRDNKKLEVIWWGIPIAIIVVLSIVTYITSHSLDPYRAIKSDKPALEVKVIALQWKWLFIYPEQKIASVNDLTIPADRPVHFTLSADAPMSAFWVPDLGSQIYSMNAMSSQLNLIANETGTYKGYNTNINGEGYAKMVFDVHSVREADFDTWAVNIHDTNPGLNEFEYEKLATPAVASSPQYFRLDDNAIYEKTIMKYMHGSGDTAHGSSADDDMMGTMEHDYSNREGQ